MKKNCEVCNIEFEAERKTKKTCSAICRQKLSRTVTEDDVTISEEGIEGWSGWRYNEPNWKRNGYESIESAKAVALSLATKNGFGRVIAFGYDIHEPVSKK